MTAQNPDISPARRGMPHEGLMCLTEEDKQRMLRRKMRVYSSTWLSAAKRAGASSPVNQTRRKAAGV